MLRRLFGSALFGILLSACAQSSIHLISSDDISSVVNDVKYQTSVYAAQAKYFQLHPRDDDQAILAAKKRLRCGNGDINVVLTAVKIELATTLDSTSGASFSTSVPLSAITIGPSVSGSAETTNSQELVFNEYPVGNARIYAHKYDTLPPIAVALFALRKALILGAANDGICFQSVPSKNADKAAANTFKIALAVVEDGKGGVSVGVGALNFGASQEVKSTTGNTITVTFELQDKKGGGTIQFKAS